MIVEAAHLQHRCRISKKLGQLLVSDIVTCSSVSEKVQDKILMLTGGGLGTTAQQHYLVQLLYIDTCAVISIRHLRRPRRLLFSISPQRI